jgi:hypothetical protein
MNSESAELDDFRSSHVLIMIRTNNLARLA